MKSISQQEIDRWISAPRFSVFLAASGGDRRQAMALYDWNVCLSAVFFEVLSYAEVLLRNAIDAQFTPVSHQTPVQQTWLYDPAILNKTSLHKVYEAEQRLIAQGKQPTRGRVVAALSFGFWRAILDKKYKNLWISNIHPAFPNGTGDRSQVAALLANLNPFRNRLAHHEALINSPVQARHDDLLELARIIDADTAGWIAERSCVVDVLAWRPPLSPTRRLRARINLSPRILHFHDT